MKEYTRTIDPLGRVSIPKEIKEALGLTEAGELCIRLIEDSIVITRKAAYERDESRKQG